MAKIVLAGGTGHLGNLLAKGFVKEGWEVIVLTRQQQEGKGAIRHVLWDGETLGEWTKELEEADTLINLSGKSIQCRFTERNKKLLESSRVLPTRALGQAIGKLSNPPRLWINFSGISIFDGLNTIQDESSTLFGNDFLAELTLKWESAFFGATPPHTHKVALRISPVLSPHAGMFAELYPLVRKGLGGQVGNGKQIVPWIHEQDLVDLVFWIIQHETPSPVYHACSPYAISNADFMKAFRQAVGVKIGLPLPTFMARLGAYVKGVDPSLLLQSAPATTRFLVDEGFEFSYPDLVLALTDLIYSNLNS